MIDRGDLAAEVGLSKLSEFSNNIINDAKNLGKPTIIATENFRDSEPNTEYIINSS